MAVRTRTSAAGVLALLAEPEPDVQDYALGQLNALVPQFWAEISESISTIEAIVDNKSAAPDTNLLASLITSKVYYYLGEYDEALSFALGAGKLFEHERNIPGSSEYVETVISKAVDRYTAARLAEETGASSVKIDARLAAIVESIFNTCISEGEYRQVRISELSLYALNFHLEGFCH